MLPSQDNFGVRKFEISIEIYCLFRSKSVGYRKKKY
ncbi:hypothetical protein PRBEI_2000084400 [Prionailurus iriomotensis]